MRLLVQTTNKERISYVLVDVEYFDNRSLPQNGRPLQLLEPKKRWKFDGVMDSKLQSLQRYWRVTDENGADITDEVKTPGWHLVSENVTERIPYGMDIPRILVRLKDKYKVIGN